MSDGSELADLGHWISVAELARLKNIARQSAGERVDRLENEGKITVKRDGRSKMINLAEYNFAVGEVGDASKEAGAATKAISDADDGPAPNNHFRDAQTREKQYAADLKYLELNERLGKLVPADEVEAAAIKAAEDIISLIDRIAGQAEAVAAAVAKDGATGARTKLKEIARDVRQGIATAMAKLAGSAVPLKIETGNAADDD